MWSEKTLNYKLPFWEFGADSVFASGVTSYIVLYMYFIEALLASHHLNQINNHNWYWN